MHTALPLKLISAQEMGIYKVFREIAHWEGPAGKKNVKKGREDCTTQRNWHLEFEVTGILQGQLACCPLGKGTANPRRNVPVMFTAATALRI
jgi:hypothetical protein